MLAGLEFLDLLQVVAAMGAFMDAKVDHQECMVRGGRMCRFKLLPKAEPGGRKGER